MDDLRKPTIAITYKDDGNQDGICSQLLRIYGVYAISRSLDVAYLHSPIAHLGYHGLQALENNSPLPDLLADVNRVFHINSDLVLPDRQVVIHDMIDADAELIGKMKHFGRDSNEVHLIRILYPFPITDSAPELYRCLQDISPFPYRPSKVFRLAVHVRRGELFAVSSDWMLPNSYYVSCVLRFQNVLRELNIPFVCELYTEVPSKAFEVTPEHHGVKGRIRENVMFDPKLNHIEDFDEIPNLERFINADPIDSLRRMATADALIISHSSFSYLPAILNPECTVVYHPYWRGRMKHWLISDDNGVFSGSALIDRLQRWKQETGYSPAAAVSRTIDETRKGLLSNIEHLLAPFQAQSCCIRSVVAIGYQRIEGVPEGTGTEQFLVGEGGVRPVGPIEGGESVLNTLDDFTDRARERSASLPGDDLLLISAQMLVEALPPPDEEVSFRAVVVLMNKSFGNSWKLRRSLFDRGLVCIGSVDFAGGKALGFLASDAVQDFNRLDVESRGHVAMPTLLDGAGFANQLWRYACVKLYAMRHALTPALPVWEGNHRFGLLDQSSEGFAFPRIAYPGFAADDRELWDLEEPPIDIELAGYFQEIPECWRKHRELLRHMFQPAPVEVQAAEAWRDAVTDGGRRTLVVISIRRGDYHRFQFESFPWFRIVPEEWYLNWLRSVWPTLNDPVLFVASDETDKMLPVFREFHPIQANSETIDPQLPHHISDFEVMRRADYLAICNSSFPRFAAILAPSRQKCFIPSFETQSFRPYEPWIDPAFWPRFLNTWRPIDVADKYPQSPCTEEPTVFFDVSALLHFLLDHEAMDNIHRFEWEILRCMPEISGPSSVRFAVLNNAGHLKTIETRDLFDLIDHVQSKTMPRSEITSEVRALFRGAKSFTLVPRDLFLTIGEFWREGNVGTTLLGMKNLGAIIGVLVQDGTPVVAPEYVDPAGSRTFVKGITGALSFANFILTTSEYNKRSLVKCLGDTLASTPVQVVPFGHALTFRARTETTVSATVAGILGAPYVLCAGTIEARTNPVYLFNIWKLMARSGRPNVPYLVFAGRKGWLAEHLIHQLEACKFLDGRVVVVQDPTETEIDALYRNCILTAFPSLGEGWPLPVGESLAHGKICLCSEEGSIPEVGLNLADYVDPYNCRDGLEKLARYLDDPVLRRERELEITTNFKQRSWRQAAEDLLTSARTLARQAPPFENLAAVTLPSGRYVPICCGEEPAVAADKLQGNGKMERGLPVELACVSGWQPAEVSGVRACRPTAILRFRTNAAVGVRVNVVLRLEACGRGVRIRVSSSSGAETVVSLAEGATKVAVLATGVEPDGLITAHLVTLEARLRGDESLNDSYWMLKGILYFEPKAAELTGGPAPPRSVAKHQRSSQRLG